MTLTNGLAGNIECVINSWLARYAIDEEDLTMDDVQEVTLEIIQEIVEWVTTAETHD